MVIAKQLTDRGRQDVVSSALYITSVRISGSSSNALQRLLLKWVLFPVVR